MQCAPLFMNESNGGASWSGIGFFVCLKDQAAKAVWEPYLDTWERPQPRLSVQIVTRTEVIFNWAPTVRSCAAFIKTCHHITQIWLWCLAYPYQWVSWWLWLGFAHQRYFVGVLFAHPIVIQIDNASTKKFEYCYVIIGSKFTFKIELICRFTKIWYGISCHFQSNQNSNEWTIFFLNNLKEADKYFSAYQNQRDNIYLFL